ncbi:BTAD domain-containing putative transcriptional regulator [Spirillospora sp. NPDC047279]|uniref:AfsR/SARP family transcriptional regulator n=1 Tax=Spirillospora sp. NPDC047279 TaxID=3155478 RepID=UPI0033FD8E7C
MKTHGGRTISVGLLGPFEITVGGVPVVLTAGRLRALVSVLALSAGRPVSVDRLSLAVWSGEEPPVNVRRSVQTYLARLRGLLGPASIRSTPTGYALNVDSEAVDVLRFVGLLEAADGDAARLRLAEALELWRGEPFDGVPSTWLHESEAPWLVERYLIALERRLDLDISGGRHERVVVELSELTTRYPLRESLWARLLIALDRSGRRADALTRYETVRARIAAELGVEPDTTLQRIHVDLLARRTPSLRSADHPHAPN